jgi:xanthine dehydrogenase accessory factor
VDEIEHAIRLICRTCKRSEIFRFQNKPSVRRAAQNQGSHAVKELSAILRILAATTEGVLASLLRVEGSSYRRVGARLLWRPDGLRVGSISGGCLEEDLLERAKKVHTSRIPETVVYDTTGENDLVWGVGLGCHGVVHILLEPISGLHGPWDFVAQAWQRREAVALYTTYHAGTPTTLGAQFACAAGGAIWSRSDTAPPGLARQAELCLQGKDAIVLERGLLDANEGAVIEYLPPPLSLQIFGAGDDAQPLCRLAKELGWLVSVIDPRSAYASRTRFPEADAIHVMRAEDVAQLPWDARTVAVVMTHHYIFDLPILRALLPRQLPYLGLLGPKKRADKILHDLGNAGLTTTPEMLQTLRAPVGLDLGGSAPEEVGAAIVAEILAVLNRRNGKPLRERSQPIHG